MQNKQRNLTALLTGILIFVILTAFTWGGVEITWWLAGLVGGLSAFIAQDIISRTLK